MTELVYPQSIDAGTVMAAAEVQANFDAVSDVVNGQLQGGSGSDGNLAANGVTARELADALLLKGIPASNMQEGVVAAGDLKVTPGSGLVLNYASGTAWITDDSGVLASGALLPATVTGATVTITSNASGNPRIDQIILTLTGHNTGTVSILAGTATAGATLDNRTGAAALPSDAVRLADILMPNGFAGPFVQNTHIRDRRPWARGAYRRILRTADAAAGNDYDTTSTSFVSIDSTNMRPRIEFSGVPVRVTIQGHLSHSAAGGVIYLVPWLDGAAPEAAGGDWNIFQRDTNMANMSLHLSHDFTPSAGSHLVEWAFRTASGTATLLARASIPLNITFQELIRQDAENSGA